MAMDYNSDRSLAHDLALSWADTAETSQQRLDELHLSRDPNRSSIAREHQRQELALRLADVHANLAVAEEVAEVRRLLVSRVVGL